jgi:phage tail-like protein
MAARNTDPYRNFRFALELGNIQVAGFAECTGLNIETKVFEYKEGGNNQTTLKFPEHTTYGNVTLKKGMTNSNDLIDWQLDVATGKFSKNARSDTLSVAIVLHDESGSEVKRWNLKRPLPVKWIGAELKATGNDVAIETLEIAHEGIERSKAG